MPRFKDMYIKDVAPALMKKFGKKLDGLPRPFGKFSKNTTSEEARAEIKTSSGK